MIGLIIIFSGHHLDSRTVWHNWPDYVGRKSVFLKTRRERKRTQESGEYCSGLLVVIKPLFGTFVCFMLVYI